MKKGDRVISRTGEIGIHTGGKYMCRLEGCSGYRIATRWPDGRMTYPCSKGMTLVAEGVAQIM